MVTNCDNEPMKVFEVAYMGESNFDSAKVQGWNSNLQVAYHV